MITTQQQKEMLAMLERLTELCSQFPVTPMTCQTCGHQHGWHCRKYGEDIADEFRYQEGCAEWWYDDIPF